MLYIAGREIEIVVCCDGVLVLPALPTRTPQWRCYFASKIGKMAAPTLKGYITKKALPPVKSNIQTPVTDAFRLKKNQNNFLLKLCICYYCNAKTRYTHRQRLRVTCKKYFIHISNLKNNFQCLLTKNFFRKKFLYNIY